MSRGSAGVRYAEVEVSHGDLRAQVVLDLDGGTRQDIFTGSATFDHLLTLMAQYGRLDLGVQVEGDIRIDDHAIADIVGCAIGQAIGQSIKGSEAICRFSDKSIVRESVLVRCGIDADGKGTMSDRVSFIREVIGDLSTQSISEFFRGVCFEGRMSCHFDLSGGDNPNHICEAMFIAFGFCLHEATRILER